MPLKYYPKLGEVVICHYDVHAVPPEMTKSRPVIVIGPRLRRRGNLATIVPLSTTIPTTIENYHCKIFLTAPLPAPFDATTMWAKCDMIAAVSLDRLDRFRERKGHYGGSRRWITSQINTVQIEAVRAAILCSLGLDSLTKVT